MIGKEEQIMKQKQKIKICVDLLMTALLLSLMAYQIIGQELHEWFGAGMLVLFLLHNVLNMKWYRHLFKGKYTPVRIVQTIVNLGVLSAMLCLGYSGIVLSRHVFSFIQGGPMATARTMHLAASYWGFVMMSLHAGLHWGIIMGMTRKFKKKKSQISVWISRLAALAIAGYGLFCFISADIPSYMLLKNHFVFFDFEQSAVSVFAEYAAMMGFWIFAGHYFIKVIGKLNSLRAQIKENYDENKTNSRKKPAWRICSEIRRAQ